MGKQEGNHRTKNLFHVHTKRCGHASDENDEEYIKKAIALGAQSITFTDHAPFPGNPFNNRMLYEQLNEYVESLQSLGNMYKKRIDVKVGLEVEFLPSFIEYYKDLKRSSAIDVLVLGQHFYEIERDKYSFSLKSNEMNEKEFIGCGQSIIDGINTGLFDVVAHPDRIFRRRKSWDTEMERVSKAIIDAARCNNVLLEQNESSKQQKHYYWEEFWTLVPNELVMRGLDAHSTNELRLQIQ